MQAMSTQQSSDVVHEDTSFESKPVTKSVPLPVLAPETRVAFHTQFGSAEDTSPDVRNF